MTDQVGETLGGSSAAQDYLISLNETTRSDIGKAGSKAANLGELVRAGFRVPEGYVLTTKAFERFLEVNGLTAPTVDGISSGKVPKEIKQAFVAVLGSIGDSLLAVRSSATSEDLATASFAGQYETVLGVKGEEELERAVKKCWASAYSSRITTYSKSAGEGGPMGIGVLVQRLIRADASGVAFTADPVTGSREEVVVNSVKGLGERLVSGRASPDEWRIRGSSVSCKAAPEGAIAPSQALMVAELAERIEKHFGSPQDIEWAFSGDRLYLLQARPITSHPTMEVEERAAPVPVPVEVPEGYWQWDEEHFPGPVSPMDGSFVFGLSIKETGRRVFEDLGLPFEGVEFKTIGGRPYMRIIPPGGKDRAPPPSWMMPILVRLVPQVRSMNRKAVEAVRGNRHMQYVDSWYEEWRPSLEKKTGELLGADLASLSDAELERRVSSTLSVYHEVLEAHMKLVFATVLPVSRFSYFCEASLGWPRRKVLEMLASDSTSEPTRKLAELARMASGNTEFLKLSRTKDDRGALQGLRNADPGLADAFDVYMKEYGSLPEGYTLDRPTFSENPLLVIKLIRDQMRRQGENSSAGDLTRRRLETVEEARKALSARGQRVELERFDRLLKDAERAYPTIDGTQFYAMRCRGVMRLEMLEVGSRLVKKGVLKRPGDVFYLGVEEARDALRSGAKPGLSELLEKRKGERAWAEAHPGPKSYGKPPGPPPSMKGFPPEVREVMQSLMWMLENIIPSRSGGEKASDLLSGIGASSGRYTGPARLVRNESEFGKIRPGDVLVCPVTSPTWTVLFANVGALVTDIGGLLSHPAIIAREYRIPAVLATVNATKLLHDGEMVTVDGDVGMVRVESGMPER